MSFLEAPFEHDIFVSYAHADPRGTGKSKLRHWSQRLVEELIDDIHAVEIEFADLDVFIDRELDPTIELTHTLREKVGGSGLLLIVMSPHYLSSAWCRDELDWFNSEIRRRANGKGCVLVVRAVPTAPEQWPDCLKDERGHTVLGFWFHPRPAQDVTFPFGWPDPLPQDREFFQELGKLDLLSLTRES